MSRSHRRSLVDYLASLAGLYPYRCQECEHRFRARRRHRRRLPASESLRWARCPKCHSPEVDRIGAKKVPPTWTNIVHRLLAAPAYRCPDCRKRFFDFRPHKPAAVKKA